MQKTPKSLRLQIGLFGRTNVGKSSLLNLIAGQDVAITSSVPGTTTDVVEKTMELLPLGPVVLLDTAGLDDESELGGKRVERTLRALDRADVVVFVVEPHGLAESDRAFLRELADRKKPFVAAVNKSDLAPPDPAMTSELARAGAEWLALSTLDPEGREAALRTLKRALARLIPEEFLRTPSLLGDLLPAGGLVALVVPIDLQAPKGRLILPQVQAIRDALDHDQFVLVAKERELASAFARLARPPDLVVCDSQAVLKTVADTPPAVKCTTFSILLARMKGDLAELARGAAAIDGLAPGDRVLVAESCTHHAAEDDIGRVKIPRWLRQFVGGDLAVDHYAGRDYPADLSGYKLIVHCGSCMLTRGEMLYRIGRAREAGVPITNYGLAISHTQGVLARTLGPFPAALDAFERERERARAGTGGGAAR